MQNITNNHPLFFYSEIKGKKKQTRKVAFAGVYDNNTLKIGQSICSEKDVFDKKKGRLIAQGRANKKPLVTIDLNIHKDKKISDVFVANCKELLK